jgi:hypothetical protein
VYKPKPDGNNNPGIAIDFFCGSGGFTAGDIGYKNVVGIKAMPYLY